MQFVGVVKRVGRSLVVEIPPEVVHRLGLRSGDQVEVSVRRRKSRLGAEPGLGPFTHADRADHHDS